MPCHASQRRARARRSDRREKLDCVFVSSSSSRQPPPRLASSLFGPHVSDVMLCHAMQDATMERTCIISGRGIPGSLDREPLLVGRASPMDRWQLASHPVYSKPSAGLQASSFELEATRRVQFGAAQLTSQPFPSFLSFSTFSSLLLHHLPACLPLSSSKAAFSACRHRCASQSSSPVLARSSQR